MKIVAISHASFVSINRTFYNRLRDKGFDVELVVPKSLEFAGKIKYPDPPGESDVPIHFLELIGKNPRLQNFKGINNLLDKHRPEIIYLDNDPVSLMACRLGWWSKKNKAKLICQSCENLSLRLSDVYKREGPRGLAGGIVKNTIAFVSRQLISHVFVISNDGLKVFQMHKFKSVSKIPLGFPESAFYPDPVKRDDIRNKHHLRKIVVAYFGRLVPEKGVHILLKALSHLKQYEWQMMMDEFDLYANPYSTEVHSMIVTLGLKDRVTFIHANHNEVAAYMNASDIVVLASVSTPRWREQYGRVIPEAMACGKVVIVAKSGTLPELVGDAGLTFDEGHEDGLKDILEKIFMNQDAFKPYSERAAVRAREALSVEAQVKDVLEIISRFK